LATCIEKAQRALRAANISGEILIADNGSTDRSPEIAQSLGARVIHVEEKGYGNALMGGISAARGQFIIMGDADDSYDFLDIAKFVLKLREGFDLVQGCRLPSGGGTVLPGAMPFLHIAIGILGYCLALPGVTIHKMTLDAHSLLFASLAILCGYQSIQFAVFTKLFAITEGLMPPDPRLNKLFELVNLERGLIFGLITLIFGLLLLAVAINQWRIAAFGRLDYSHTMRWVIPGATLTAIG